MHSHYLKQFYVACLYQDPDLQLLFQRHGIKQIHCPWQPPRIRRYCWSYPELFFCYEIRNATVSQRIKLVRLSVLYHLPIIIAKPWLYKLIQLISLFWCDYALFSALLQAIVLMQLESLIIQCLHSLHTHNLKPQYIMDLMGREVKRRYATFLH